MSSGRNIGTLFGYLRTRFGLSQLATNSSFGTRNIMDSMRVLTYVGLGVTAYKATQYLHFRHNLSSLKPSNGETKENAESVQKVLPQQMLSTGIESLDNEKRYRVGFSRKHAFGITHSSLAFLDEASATEERWLIMGRQSSYNLKPTAKSRKLVEFFRVWQIMTTAVDNEKKYDLFKHSDFNVELTNAHLTGGEIKAIVKETDTHICRSQIYNAIISNCYSASIFMLTRAIHAVDGREENPNSKASSIASIYDLLTRASLDNFSQGVSNNPVVTAALQDTQKILLAHQLIEKKGSSPELPRPSLGKK